MMLLPDDPIIACIERTGYPSWIDADYEEDEKDEEVEPVMVWLHDGRVYTEFMEFDCREDATEFCEEHDWEWVDDNSFCWELVIDD